MTNSGSPEYYMWEPMAYDLFDLIFDPVRTLIIGSHVNVPPFGEFVVRDGFTIEKCDDSRQIGKVCYNKERGLWQCLPLKQKEKA